jgi:hypothetical protein
MPAILVNRVVDKKGIIVKMEGPGGGEAKRVTDPKNVFSLVSQLLRKVFNRTD